MTRSAGAPRPAGGAARRAGAAALLALAASLSAACAVAPVPSASSAPGASDRSLPAATPPSYAELAARFTDRALERERAGDLRRARAAWLAVAALRPDAEEPRRQVEELAARLAAEAELHYRDGLARIQEGKWEAARRELLLALLADPDHAPALEALQAELGMEAEPFTVDAGETFESVALGHYGDASLARFVARVNRLDPATDPAAGTVLSLPELPSRAAGAEEGAAPPTQEPAGSGPAPIDTRTAAPPPATATPAAPPPPAKPAPPPAPADPQPPRAASQEPSVQDRERAEELYNAGVRHFVNQNLDAAIRSWERALALNPAHPNAAKDIEKARELQRKLLEVR